MSILPFSLPLHPMRSERGDFIGVIFAAHRAVQLLVGDGRCVCGLLTGPSTSPKSHTTPFCPVGDYYAKVDEFHKAVGA